MDTLAHLFEAHRIWVQTCGRMGKQICLDEQDLRHLAFKDPMMSQSFLTVCRFSEVSFDQVDFYRSELYSCDFTGARFLNCDFCKATLDFSCFSDALFIDCHFNRTDVYQGIFKNCMFRNCAFSGLNLMKADLQGAHFENIDFEDVYIDHSKMAGCHPVNPKNLHKAVKINCSTDQRDLNPEGIDAIQALLENT